MMLHVKEINIDVKWIHIQCKINPVTSNPAVETKRPYHHGDLRAALIRAALSLIEEHGVKGLALSDAARLAGVSVAAPYRHFKDKEALLAEIAAEGFVMFRDALARGLAKPPRGQGQAPGGDGRGLCRFRPATPLSLQGDVGGRDRQSKVPGDGTDGLRGISAVGRGGAGPAACSAPCAGSKHWLRLPGAWSMATPC